MRTTSGYQNILMVKFNQVVETNTKSKKGTVFNNLIIQKWKFHELLEASYKKIYIAKLSSTLLFGLMEPQAIYQLHTGVTLVAIQFLKGLNLVNVLCVS